MNKPTCEMTKAELLAFVRSADPRQLADIIAHRDEALAVAEACSETPNRCRGCNGILTPATHCNDCAMLTGGEGT